MACDLQKIKTPAVTIVGKNQLKKRFLILLIGAFTKEYAKNPPININKGSLATPEMVLKIISKQSTYI